MLGLSKRKICKILNTENKLSFLMAFIFSIPISTILYIILCLSLIKVFSLNIDWKFNFEVKPYACTFILTVVLLIIIMISNYFLIKDISIIELSELDQHSEGKIKTSVGKSILGIGSLLIGFGLVLDLTNRPNSIWDKVGYSPIMLLTVLLVMIGTIFIIKNSIGYLISYLIKNDKIMFKKVNNIFLPQALFKLKTKSNLLIVISFLISAVIGITSAVILCFSYQQSSLIQTVPSAIEIDKNLSEKNIEKLNRIAKKNKGELQTIGTKNLKLDSGIQLTEKIETKECQLIKFSEYNKWTKTQGKHPKLEKNRDCYITYIH